MERKRQLGNVIALWAVLLVLYTTAAARTVYVDDDAPEDGDGTSWPTAYRFPQDALTEAELAQKPVQIRVAQGTYRPDQGAGRQAGDRRATFWLEHGVTLWGGFAGLDSQEPDMCDPTQFRTILSGDLAENDVQIPGGSAFDYEAMRGDNSRRVLSCRPGETMAPAVLAGCLITAARAYGRGSGMYVTANTNVHCENCIFAGNAVLTYGAAVYTEPGVNVTLLSCVFTDNEAESSGGAAYMDRSTGRLIGCSFEKNTGRKQAGAVLLSACDMAVVNASFGGNAATTGGAVMIQGGKTRFFNTVFHSNDAARGGAMACEGRAQVDAIKCHFRGNRAAKYGGAVWASESPIKVVNSTICGNQAGRGGGGLRFADGTLALTHCTTAENRAPEGTFLLVDAAVDSSSRVTVNNSIIAESAFSVWSQRTVANVHHTNLVGGQAAIYDPENLWRWAPGNVDVAPGFADPGRWDPNGTPDDRNDDRWVDGDYHLKSATGRWHPVTRSWVLDAVASDCIDAGDPNTLTRYEPSPNGGLVNLGAYGGTSQASKSGHLDGIYLYGDSEKRARLLQELLDSAEGPSTIPRMLRELEGGYLNWVTAPAGSSYPVAGPQGRSPEEVAADFIEQWRDLLGRYSPEIAFYVRRTSGREDCPRVSLNQTYASLDVHPGLVDLDVNGAGGVVCLVAFHTRDARELEGRPELLVPSIGLILARHTGQSILSERYPGPEYVASNVRLEVLDPFSGYGPQPPPTLVWRMDVQPAGGGCGEYLRIEAHTGECLWREPTCIW